MFKKLKTKKPPQNAGAWFNGDNSPLMIDSAIAPNLLKQIQQTGGNKQQRVQQIPRFQQTFPQPSRQVNETYASFNQQGGKQPRGCGKQTDKKYLTRASPPFPANECCGMTIVGNNSKPWISKANVNGICRWVEIKKE
mgnify:CR=1 FL=1